MCKKLIYLTSFVLLLSIAGNASAGLVAHWMLDDDSGTIAADSSGNGQDGTLQGDPNWVTGYFGGALEFDVNDYVNIDYSPEFSLNNFTVSAWVNIAAEPPSEFGVFGTRDGGNKTFDIAIIPDAVHADLGSGSDWINTSLQITPEHTGTNGQGGDLAVDTWYMIAYAVDNTNQQVRLYLDADLKRTIDISGVPLLMVDSGDGMRIGETGYGSEWMNGMIDDVRIYDRALTDGEVYQAMIFTPELAAVPIPEDNATFVPRDDVVLSWEPGEFAAPTNGHKVYPSTKSMMPPQQ